MVRLPVNSDCLLWQTVIAFVANNCLIKMQISGVNALWLFREAFLIDMTAIFVHISFNDSTIMREPAVLCLGPIQSWKTDIHFVFVFNFVPVFIFPIVSLVFVFVFHFAFLFVFAIVFERMDVNPWSCITLSLSLTLRLCFFLLWLCVCACLWLFACL